MVQYKNVYRNIQSKVGANRFRLGYTDLSWSVQIRWEYKDLGGIIRI